MAAKEREHARLALPIHVNRADVKIILVGDQGDQKLIAARALLTDFKPKGIYLYSTERLPPNLEVIFEVNHPESFRIVGKIIWCQYQPSSSRVLSDQSFHYRVGMGFHFLNVEDEKRYAEYCTKIQNFYVSPRVLFENTPDILMRVDPTSSPVAKAAAPVLQAVPNLPESDQLLTTQNATDIAASASAAENGAAMNPEEIEALLAEVGGESAPTTASDTDSKLKAA